MDVKTNRPSDVLGSLSASPSDSLQNPLFRRAVTAAYCH